jgi:iron(III) transport system ATP-binding protein
VAPNRRNFGMVFQSYAIWPHMNVLENVAYALEGRGLSRAVMREQAIRALDTVQLGHLADRPAPRLSGGQQQRVAIARAIVANPQALLFDEPLSNLDARLRAEMRNELKRLQRSVGLTSVYVTHDQAEALALSDWIIVMKDGHIVEHGRPVDIYRHPRSVFTAQFVGQTNLIDGTVVSRNQASGGVLIETAVGRIAGTDIDRTLPEGAKVKLSVRPEDITASDTAEAPPASDGAYNVVRGHLRFSVFAGSVIEAEVDCGGTVINCFLGRDADMTIGRSVTLAMAPRACLALPDA